MILLSKINLILLLIRSVFPYCIFSAKSDQARSRLTMPLSKKTSTSCLLHFSWTCIFSITLLRALSQLLDVVTEIKWLFRCLLNFMDYFYALLVSMSFQICSSLQKIYRWFLMFSEFHISFPIFQILIYVFIVGSFFI